MADFDTDNPGDTPDLIAALSNGELGRIRELSQALFKAKHRLPLAVVIAGAPPEALYAEMLAEPAGASETQASSELRNFHQAGLLEELPAAPWKGQRGRPPKLYARLRQQKWDLLRQLAEPDNQSPAEAAAAVSGI